MSVQYTRGYSVHWGISFSTPGGVQHTRGYHEYSGGVQYSGRISWVHRGMFSTLGFPYKFNCFPNDLPLHLSWYPLGVLMISPSVLNTPGVLNILRCTAHPPVYCTDMQGESKPVGQKFDLQIFRRSVQMRTSNFEYVILFRSAHEREGMDANCTKIKYLFGKTVFWENFRSSRFQY